jgi:hypothetical protein
LIDVFSLQLFAVLIPIVGLGAFLWWAGRDMIQGTVRLLAAAFIEKYLVLQLAIYGMNKPFLFA